MKVFENWSSCKIAITPNGMRGLRSWMVQLEGEETSRDAEGAVCQITNREPVGTMLGMRESAPYAVQVAPRTCEVFVGYAEPQVVFVPGSDPRNGV